MEGQRREVVSERDRKEGRRLGLFAGLADWMQLNPEASCSIDRLIQRGSDFQEKVPVGVFFLSYIFMSSPSLYTLAHILFALFASNRPCGSGSGVR